MEYVIDEMKPEDARQILDIYAEGIATGLATFETETPAWEKWDAGHLKNYRLVARAGDQVLGWAALSPVSQRFVYRGVVEVSLYIGSAYRGMGIGKNLLQKLVAASEEAGIWTLQSSIMANNPASLALHAACGFRVVGHRERIAQRDGVWRDTVLVERRSQTVGMD